MRYLLDNLLQYLLDNLPTAPGLLVAAGLALALLLVIGRVPLRYNLRSLLASAHPLAE